MRAVHDVLHGQVHLGFSLRPQVRFPCSLSIRSVSNERQKEWKNPRKYSFLNRRKGAREGGGKLCSIFRFDRQEKRRAGVDD